MKSPRQPSPDRRPLYEIDPQPRLITALREAFGHFAPTDPYWIRVEAKIKDVAWMTNQAGHAQFCAQYLQMNAAALLKFLHDHQMIAEPPKRRGRPTRTVDGLNVDQYLLALAVEDISVKALNPRQLEKMTKKLFSANTYRKSAVFRGWQIERLEEAAHSAKITADEIDASGLSITATGKKSVVGRERMTKRERDLDRQAIAFLAQHDLDEESGL